MNIEANIDAEPFQFLEESPIKNTQQDNQQIKQTGNSKNGKKTKKSKEREKK